MIGDLLEGQRRLSGATELAAGPSTLVAQHVMVEAEGLDALGALEALCAAALIFLLFRYL